jgi:hypothetical protein
MAAPPSSSSPSPAPAPPLLAADAVELQPLQVIDGKAGLQQFARQVDASLKRILATNQVLVIEGTNKPEPATRKASEFYLVGTLEENNGHYNVTLYFDDYQDGITLWSRRFSRPVSDSDGLREEIGAITAYAISCGLKRRARAPTKPSPQTLKVYLETCSPDLVSDDGSKAIEIAGRLMTLAPDDPYGYALAAFANAEIANAKLADGGRPDAQKTAARELAARALALDPNDALAKVASAMTGSPFERWSRISSIVKTEVDYLGSKPLFIHTFRSTGQLSAARARSNETIAHTPLSPSGQISRAYMDMHEGMFERADRVLGETLVQWPRHPGVHWYRLVNTSFYGDPEEALSLLASTAEMLDMPAVETECWETFLTMRSGAAVRDGSALRRACPVPPNSADYVVRSIAAIGDLDAAFESIRGHNFTWAGATIFLFYPEMAALRRDPRFMAAIADSSLLEYWSETDQWPDFCADKSLAYNCKVEAARVLAGKRAAEGRQAPSVAP